MRHRHTPSQVFVKDERRVVINTQERYVCVRHDGEYTITPYTHPRTPDIVAYSLRQRGFVEQHTRPLENVS